MKVVLNSRTIVGPQHAQAVAFVREWIPDAPAEVEWQESPSVRCVLGVELPAGRAVACRGTAEPLSGEHADAHLEIDLRDNLGLPPYPGDHAEGSRNG